MRAYVQASIDPQLVSRIARVSESEKLNTSRTIEYLIELGLNLYENRSADKN